MENSKPRVLVIDDDVDCLTLVEATLSNAYEVKTLADPRHTFEILNQFFPDLIVLDVMMPTISGYQLLEKLRKYHAFQNVPVMFLSAKGQIDDIKKGYELGAAFYLTKPFQADRLRKTIESVFQKHPPQKQPRPVAPRPGTQSLTPSPGASGNPASDSKHRVSVPPPPKPDAPPRPNLTPAPAADAPRRTAPKKRVAEGRILAVDDDKDILDLLHETLQGRFDLLACLDSTDVPQLIDSYQPDLIITDVMMPKVSGFQLVEYLKRSPEMDRVPIIFLSAKTTEADRRLADRLGAVMYLCKPFEPRDLSKEIDALFRKHPPSKDPKKFTLRQVQERIDIMTTYKLSTNPDLLTKIQSNQPMIRHAHDEVQERPYALRHPRLR